MNVTQRSLYFSLVEGKAARIQFSPLGLVNDLLNNGNSSLYYYLFIEGVNAFTVQSLTHAYNFIM